MNLLSKAAAHPRPVHVGIATLAFSSLVLPFSFDPFLVSQLTLVVTYAVAVLGLNLLVGYSGQISLGHGAFFALGAYVCAILVDRVATPYPLAIVLAGSVSWLAGLGLGIPALRLRGLYLALVTLSVAVATPVLVTRFEGVTGGSQGLTVVQPAAPTWTGLAADQFIYFCVLACAVPLFAFVVGLVRSDVGRALLAIRDGETSAQAVGINPATYKIRVFGVSAGYAGVAGALSVLSTGFVAPESFTVLLSFSFLAAVVVGGIGTISGALFGALFIVFVPSYTADINEALSGVIYGATLMACMYLFRGGIAGLISQVLRRLAGSHRTTIEKGSAHVHG